MRRLTWKKWLCWMLCLFLLGLPACGGSDSGNGDSNTSSGGSETPPTDAPPTDTTTSSNLIIQVTFSEDMDTSIPAGVSAASLFQGLLGPRAAYAGTACCNDCVSLNAVAVLVSAIWLSARVMQLEYAGINPGDFLLTLNDGSCTDGFQTADGFLLATVVLAVAFTLGQIVHLAVQVRP